MGWGWWGWWGRGLGGGLEAVPWTLRVHVAAGNPQKNNTLKEGGCKVDPKIHHTGGEGAQVHLNYTY